MRLFLRFRLCPILLKFTILALVVPNVFARAQLTYLKWYLGMVVKQTKSLLHRVLKIVLVANVVNRRAQLIF